MKYICLGYIEPGKPGKTGDRRDVFQVPVTDTSFDPQFVAKTIRKRPVRPYVPIAMGAAGWHICFDVLDRLLSGTPIGRMVGPEAVAAPIAQGASRVASAARLGPIGEARTM